MKKLILVGIMLVLLMPDTFSQTISDSSLYDAGITILNRAKTCEQFLEAAFYFKQMTDQLSGQWPSYYYAGFAYIRASQIALDSKYKDDLIDKAQPMIDKAFVIRPGESELHALQALLYQARLQVNPEARALSYSQKADASLKKAVAADQSNPRAYMLMGYNIYYTPVLFGGGAKKALPLFLKAREKFNAFKPELSFFPAWGASENQQMIRECNQAPK
jgi:tetratricopeptide (TPR) repeat protein